MPKVTLINTHDNLMPCEPKSTFKFCLLNFLTTKSKRNRYLSRNSTSRKDQTLQNDAFGVNDVACDRTTDTFLFHVLLLTGLAKYVIDLL